mmetsp:Transcript_48116/g.125148  ORF Transcript_48116/g.125148 Transcript_48116/m.125148 type:complete len:204 (-) Transcript_48116:3-614(-)
MLFGPFFKNTPWPCMSLSANFLSAFSITFCLKLSNLSTYSSVISGETVRFAIAMAISAARHELGLLSTHTMKCTLWSGIVEEGFAITMEAGQSRRAPSDTVPKVDVLLSDDAVELVSTIEKKQGGMQYVSERRGGTKKIKPKRERKEVQKQAESRPRQRVCMTLTAFSGGASKALLRKEQVCKCAKKVHSAELHLQYTYLHLH